MPKRAFLPLMLFLVAVTCLRAQVDTDSLERRLEIAVGTDRIATLAALAETYQRSNPPRTIAYGREALTLVNRTPDDRLRLRVLHQKGRAHIGVSDYMHSLAVWEVIGDRSGLARVLTFSA